MREGLIKITAAVTTALILASGCSDKQNGTATAVPTTGGNTAPTREPGSTTPSAPGGAPKVTNPLDASKFLTQPCAVLSAAQLKTFNITTPGKSNTDSTTGPGCSWSNDDLVGYNIGFLTINKNGLSDIYRAGKEFWEGYFEPTEVDGYPAVFHDLTDGRPTGSCQIAVGISDTLAFRAVEQSSSDRGPKACEGATAVAAAVIQTMKGA